MKTHGPLQDVISQTGGSAPGSDRKRPARTARTQTARRILVSALVAASLGSAAAVSLGSAASGQAPASIHQPAQMLTTIWGPWMYAISGDHPWMYAPRP